MDLVVIGGGAAGFFGAITVAEAAPGAKVEILEKSSRVLEKVRISGGGRCNVTHACFDPKELVTFYPRGSRQLIGPFHRWSPKDTMEWFEGRGVLLKIESDNRVFPKSDNAQSVIDCLKSAAESAGVTTRTGRKVDRIFQKDDGGFILDLSNGGTVQSKNVLLTTGGIRDGVGAQIAEQFGHRIQPAAPSLFTFKIGDPRIVDLMGLTVPDCRVRVGRFAAGGPVLITHWGLSGPGILRVSALGARELQESGYRFECEINWCGGRNEDEVQAHLDRIRAESPKRKVVNDPQFHIPSRLWGRLVEASAETSAAEDLRWTHLPKGVSKNLVQQLCASRFAVEGKSMNKEEFVTCGGIDLRDVEFKTLESRITPGLFFAGEVLDIDGMTGGFNFQAAWTTSRIAGETIAERI